MKLEELLKEYMRQGSDVVLSSTTEGKWNLRIWNEHTAITKWNIPLTEVTRILSKQLTLEGIERC